LVVPAAGQVELGWLKTFDLRASWQLKLRERFIIEPSAALFNVFNFGNFDGANNTLGPTLESANPLFPNPGPAANNTTSRAGLSTRTGFGTGVFGLGAPRALEFGLRITF
jgi:hypothetical protein